jgi:chitinase
LNLGLAFYAKYFTTQGDCSQPTGCPTAVLETPDGRDTALSGAMVFDEKSYGNASFANVMKNGKEDATKGGEYYWDPATKAYWTWDTAALMTRKIQEIAVAKKLGGIFAWSLCQDSHDWSRVKAMQAGAKTLKP